MHSSPWRRGPLSRNPYYYTAFHVLRMPPSVVQRHAVRQHVLQARNLAAAMPQAHRICGELVTESEINEASEILAGGPSRLWEELVAHRPEEYITPGLQRLRERLHSLAPEAPMADDGPPLRLPALLRRWMEHLLSQQVGETTDSELVSASTYRPIPPCGGGT
ncbi:MAG: hypothetical protein U9R79_09615 [Armatimonadota bacterium]|nr:hypothetical protein [Armatimonadota bacterium]